MGNAAAADIALTRDDYASAHRLATTTLAELQPLAPPGSFQQLERNTTIALAADTAAHAALQLGDYAAAAAARQGLAAQKLVVTDSVQDRRGLAIRSTWLALALARHGELAESARVIAPVVQFDRELAAKNHGDVWVPSELANALYVEALTDKTRSPALLREADSLLRNLPPSLRGLHDVRQWRARVKQALGKPLASNMADGASRSAG